jgi:signal peptidase II
MPSSEEFGRISLFRRSQNWLVLVVVAALTLVADRVTKLIVTNNLTLNETWEPPALHSVFSITYTTNTGAAFGLFPKQGALFVLIAFVVITAIIVYYRYLPEGYMLARVALGLMLAGALGNLIDRLRQGYVVDFADLNFWPLQNWPVFNVADSAIVVGVGLLAITMLREDAKEQDDEMEETETDAASEPGTSS